MSTYTPDPDPAPVTRIARPVVPGAAQRLLTPLDLGLQTLALYLSPADPLAVQEQFGTHLGKPGHPVLVSNAFIDWSGQAGFPALPLAVARQRLAHLSVAQYQRSILGRVMFASLRITGRERVLCRAPRQFAATTNYGTRWVAALGPQHCGGSTVRTN